MTDDRQRVVASLEHERVMRSVPLEDLIGNDNSNSSNWLTIVVTLKKGFRRNETANKHTTTCGKNKNINYANWKLCCMQQRRNVVCQW